MKNKKGQIGFMIMFFLIIAILLVAGIALIIGSSTINYVADTIVPEIATIGVVGDTNVSQTADYIITPVNNLIQSFTWLGGILYFIALLGLFGIAFTYRATTQKWLIPLFILMAIMLVLMSIFVSNMYQDIYSSTGDFGDVVKEHTILSFLMIHSPVILSVIIFVSGIILFSGAGKEEFV